MGGGGNPHNFGPNGPCDRLGPGALNPRCTPACNLTHVPGVFKAHRSLSKIDRQAKAVVADPESDVELPDMQRVNGVVSEAKKTEALINMMLRNMQKFAKKTDA